MFRPIDALLQSLAFEIGEVAEWTRVDRVSAMITPGVGCVGVDHDVCALHAGASSVNRHSKRKALLTLEGIREETPQAESSSQSFAGG